MDELVFPGGAFARARLFLDRKGRELDRARLAFALKESDAKPVIEALAAFQNTDGGFGHAIEPDLRAPSSTALATSVGLLVLREIDVPADNPLVRRAIDWLLTNLDREKFVWPIITQASTEAPHAPWWNIGDDHDASWNFYRYNPSADLFGALCQWHTLVPGALFDAMTNDFVWRLKNNPPQQIYDLYCCLRLFNSKGVPESLRVPLKEAVIAAALAQDPESFHVNYFELVPSKDSLLYPTLKARFARAAKIASETQAEDGGWHPAWNWGEADTKVWTRVETEWAGVLTRQTLESVHRHGLVA
jgi:hypothetical protein